jgi:hypothetical protein
VCLAQGADFASTDGRAGLEPTHLGAQGSHHQHERASNGLGSKGHLKALRAGTWEAWHNKDVRIQVNKPSLQIGHVLPKIPS